MMMRRGQNWTIDLLVGFIIFLSVAIFFYTVTRANLQEDTSFSDTSGAVIEQLNAENYPDGYNETPLPIQGYSLDQQELRELYSQNYSSVKDELNIQDEFCLTVVDANGSLIPVNVSGNETYSFGRGEGRVLVGDDIVCGE